MESKTDLSSYHEEPAPPAYSDSSYTTFSTSASSTSQYYSAQIQSQLSSLTTQISSVRTQAELISHAQEEKILSLLTNDIQIYLSDFANSGLKKGTLLLIPAASLLEAGRNAVPTDYDFKTADEYDRVVRVRDEEDGAKMWYWRDEDMANRLAGYLRPPPPNPRTLELPLRKEQGKTKAEAAPSRGFWGWKKGTIQQQPPEPKIKANNGCTNTKGEQKESGDRVVMEVKAEEVVFRSENEFGMLCSERGYAVIVKLMVTLGDR